MDGIRRQYDRAALGLHPHHLQPQCMPRQVMQADPGIQLLVSGMKDHPSVEGAANHVDDIVGVKRRRQMPVSHGPTGAIGHLRVLHMEARLGKQRYVARMVIVHVRDHDILHVLRLHPDGGKARGDRAQQRAAALRSSGRRKAGVDHEGTFGGPDDPYVVIQRHGLRVVIAAQEIQVAEPIEVAVADGVDAIRHAEARKPPSTCRMSPLMNDAASLSRNNDALVASSS